MTQTTLRDFVPLQKLGQGSFSTVYKVKRISDSKIYALKKVRMNNLKDKQKLSAINEIRILASIDSPYIVGYKQAIYDEKLNLLCIVMEYANGGDLQRYIKKAEVEKIYINEKEIWKAIISILRGLDHLHKKNILHRDLKSANIFLSDTEYKLGDLNVSKVNKGKLAYTQIGTPYYASPEVWRQQPYDNKSDIWSFGIIIYEMAAMKPPFHGQDMEELYDNVQKGIYSKIPNCYSKDLQVVIDYCLKKSPLLRLSAEELLEHPIVMKYAERYGREEGGGGLERVEENELLRTIKIPFNMKGLQKNLPKSKYENMSNKEMSVEKKEREREREKERQYERERQRQRQHQHKYSSPKPNLNSLKLNKLYKSPSESLIPQIQRYSPRNIQPSSNYLSPSKNYIYSSGIIPSASSANILPLPISPRNKIQPTTKILPQTKSLDKLEKVFQSKKSDRYYPHQDIKKESLGSYKVEELKEIQKSLIIQQNEIEEYIQKQIKQRPITCIPKTEHGVIKSNRYHDQRGYQYGKIQEKRRGDEPNEEQLNQNINDIKKKIQYMKPRESSLQHMKEDTANVYSSKILHKQPKETESKYHIGTSNNRNLNRKIEHIKYPTSVVGKVGEYKSKLTPSYWSNE